jgi:hypothetical protein
MPSKRDVLAQFSRDELVTVVDQFELAVADRRVRDQLVDAVASSKKPGLADNPERPLSRPPQGAMPGSRFRRRGEGESVPRRSADGRIRQDRADPGQAQRVPQDHPGPSLRSDLRLGRHADRVRALSGAAGTEPEESLVLRPGEHTSGFWATLGRIIPDYEMVRVRLRTLGPALVW